MGCSPSDTTAPAAPGAARSQLQQDLCAGRSSCVASPPDLAWDPPRAAVWTTAPPSSSRGLPGHLSRLLSGAPPPLPSSLALVLAGLFLTFILLGFFQFIPCFLCSVWPFLKYVFMEAPPALLMGSALVSSESVFESTGTDPLRRDFSHRDHPCHLPPPATKALPPMPNQVGPTE